MFPQSFPMVIGIFHLFTKVLLIRDFDNSICISSSYIILVVKSLYISFIWIFTSYTKKLNSNANANPPSAMIVSMTVQDFSVWISVSPRYLPTSQKPLSFTWERMVVPEAMDMTIYKVKSKKIVLHKIKLFLCKVTRFKRYNK